MDEYLKLEDEYLVDDILETMSSSPLRTPLANPTYEVSILLGTQPSTLVACSGTTLHTRGAVQYRQTRQRARPFYFFS